MKSKRFPPESKPRNLRTQDSLRKVVERQRQDGNDNEDATSDINASSPIGLFVGLCTGFVTGDLIERIAKVHKRQKHRCRRDSMHRYRGDPLHTWGELALVGALAREHRHTESCR